MLQAFKIKPFDLEPVYASWPDGPRFVGNPKKDPPVNDWLEQIKAGCIQRKVPDEYWHKVAQHFMGDKARARLEELKTVMVKMHGGKYRWSWKKFRVAMLNMGCKPVFIDDSIDFVDFGYALSGDIDPGLKKTLKVRVKAAGMWITRKKDEERPQPAPPAPSKSITLKKEDRPAKPGNLLTRSKSVGGAMATKDTRLPPVPSRAATTDSEHPDLTVPFNSSHFNWVLR